jgi:hypothetical protein
MSNLISFSPTWAALRISCRVKSKLWKSLPAEYLEHICGGACSSPLFMPLLRSLPQSVAVNATKMALPNGAVQTWRSPMNLRGPWRKMNRKVVGLS